MKLIPPQLAEVAAESSTTLVPAASQSGSVVLHDTIPGDVAARAFDIIRSAFTRLGSWPKTLAVLEETAQGEIMHGHTAGNRTADRRAGSTRRGRPRTAGGRKNDRSVVGVTADGTVKRGRGRPKGSKNKSTLAREAAERAAKRAARVRKSVAAAPAKRPAGTIIKRAKGKAAAGGRKAATTDSRQRGGPRRRKGGAAQGKRRTGGSKRAV